MGAVKPSFTAFLIPKILTSLGPKYSTLITERQLQLSRIFRRECAKHDFGIALINYLTGKQLAVWLVEHLGIKGVSVHYAARKKYIRTQFEQVIDEISQVVVIGAGFDTLSLEYQGKHPQIKFFELDQYATQKVKLDALKKMPDVAGSNLNFIACDLSKESLREVLMQNNFNPNAKCFFVIEGVLMYLQRSDIEKLFNDINKIAANGSYIIFSSMGKLDNTNDVRAKLSDAALAVRKEKYRFAATPNEVAQLAENCGFKLVDTKLYHELQHGVQNERQIDALQKERGEHYYLAKK